MGPQPHAALKKKLMCIYLSSQWKKTFFKYLPLNLRNGGLNKKHAPDNHTSNLKKNKELL